MSKYILFFIYFIFSTMAVAQGLKGIVLSAETNQEIPFAVVHIIDLNSSISSNDKGEFFINNNLPQNIKLKITAIGYETKVIQISTLNNSLLKVFLNEKHIELAEITVSGFSNTLQKQTISNIESKSLDELSSIQNSNLADALSNINGVYQINTGVGIGKPVIRGLSGIRVVTYLNGLRIENQQWGGDHGMGVTENGVATVDVIKGPASLLYGADALGGVIYFSDENYAPINSNEINIESALESNAMLIKNYASYKISKNNLRVNLFANYSNGADYRLPNNFFVSNSRFNESNIKCAIGYNYKNWVGNIRYNFINNYAGLPGHSHDSIYSLASFISDKQNRHVNIPFQHIQNNYLLFDNSFYFTKSDLKILLGYTNNNLGEYEEELTQPNLQMTLTNASYNTRFKYNVLTPLSIIIGAQGMYQINKNSKSVEEILLPNSTMMDNGIFALAQADFKNWEIISGIRYDNRVITTLDFFKGISAFSKSYNSINYSIGVSKKLNQWVIKSNLSSGFRPPHLSELTANGTHHGAIRYEIGNSNLLSEKALQFDLNTSYINEHLNISFAPFYNKINNYTYLNPQNYTIDNFNVFIYKQAKAANLMGFDAGLHYHPHYIHQFHLEPNASYIVAFDESGNNLPLIPQTRFNTQLRYEFESTKKVKLKNIAVQHLYFLKQNKTAVYETTSNAYQIINIGATVAVKQKSPMSIKVGVKNLFNVQYIDHLSRLKDLEIASPGRNFYLAVKINFS